MDLDCRLTVLGSGERLRLLCRDRRVPLDQRRCDAAECLDRERERCDVEQDDLIDLACEHAGLNRRAGGDDLVGVNLPVDLARRPR